MFRRLHIGSVEEFEPRMMLSGHGLAALAGPIQHLESVVAHVAPAAVQHVQDVIAALQSHIEGDAEIVLTAQLIDSVGNAAGTVQFKSVMDDGTAKTTLAVNVTGAPVSSPLVVAINGNPVGTFTTDASGSLHLNLSSNPHGSQLPLPTGLTAAVGDMVTIGTLSGSLATTTEDSDDDMSEATHLTAKLTDSTVSARVQVVTDASGDTRISVRVHGAGAGAMLDVAINGTPIGSITANAKGSGKLVLSSNPHGSQLPLPVGLTVVAGDIVTVGSLTGTLAVDVDD